MALIISSLLVNTIKVVCFAVVAYVGIIFGKKFRDKKDAQKAAESKEGR